MMKLPYYLHIPKNAGTTMGEILNNNYPGKPCLDEIIKVRRSHMDGWPKTVESADQDVVQVVTEICARQDELAYVTVNLPYGIHRFLDRPVNYFTFMREPVSRCISYWFFAYKMRHEGTLWATLQSYDFNLRRILEAQAAYQFSNDQVRMITGSSNPDPGQDELQLAREIIQERFLLVGAVEQFDACLSVLARHLGWSHQRYEKLNVGDKTNTALLPHRAAELFREMNEWDIKLYEWLMADYLPRHLS